VPALNFETKNCLVETVGIASGESLRNYDRHLADHILPILLVTNNWLMCQGSV